MGTPCLVGVPKFFRDSNKLLRLSMAWICAILVGSGASVSTFVKTYKPLMILSLAEGVGMVWYACRNSTVSNITWLLVSLLSNLKHLYESSAGPM